MSKKIISLLIIAISFSACTLQKRQHLPGYHLSWHKTKKTKYIASSANEKHPSERLQKENLNHIDSDLVVSTQNSDFLNEPGYLNAVNFLISALSTKDSCDKIIDKDGDELLVKVTEIGIDVIKYKNCDHLDGPVYNIPKSSVLMIDYSNGKREVIKQTKKKESKSVEPDYSNVDNVYYDSPDSKPVRRRVEGLGLAGFITTLVSLPIWWLVSWIGGLVGGIIGIIFGAIGISRCKKNPMLTGKGFAITSLVIGIVITVLSVIFAIILF